jgi:cell wall-associated NlpC family hydrolase
MPTGADIAVYAKKYKGVPYKWGGWLPSTGWDCSGFVKFVLGGHFGLILPGGVKYSANSHGPVAAQYKVWTKATTIPTSQTEAGDLCCWLTHIGIAVDSHEMISALSPKYGTAVTSIKGPAGEPLSVRRINILAASTAGPTAATGCAPAMLTLPYLYMRGLLAGDWLAHTTETGGDECA